MAEQQTINAFKQASIDSAKVIKDEFKDQLKPLSDQLLAPLNNIKAGISALPGVGITKKLFSSFTTPFKASLAGDTKDNIDAQKERNFLRRQADSEKSLFEDIRDTLVNQNSILMKGLAGLKDKGLMGLGVLAGLVAAPVAFLTGLFSQLAIELKFLGKLFGKGATKLAGYFKPLTDFFTKLKNSKFVKSIDTLLDGVKTSISNKFTGIVEGIKKSKFVTSIDEFVKGIKTAISTKFTALGTALKNTKIFGAIDDFIKPIKTFGTNLSTRFTTIATKGDDVIKTFAGVGDKLASAARTTAGIIKRFTIIDTIVDTVKGFINPIKSAFTGIQTGAKTLTPFMEGFKPVIEFAKGIGKVLGKIFLPITILMSAFDFVIGFMDGYDEGGVLGGLEGGISKLFQGLIGMPLDLLKSGVGYILGFFGFDKAKEALDKFSFSQLIDDLVGSIFDGLKGTFKFLTDLFDFSDLTIFSVFSKLIDIVFLPLNLAINFVKDLFGFGDPDKPFSFGDFITGIIGDAIKMITDFFNIDVSAITKYIKGFIPDSLLSFFGFGDGDEKPQDPAAAVQQQIQEAQDRIAKFDAGENAYGGFDTQAKRDADAAMIAEMQKELDLLKSQGGAGTTNNYYNNDNRKSEQNVQINSQQLQDANAIPN